MLSLKFTHCNTDGQKLIFLNCFSRHITDLVLLQSSTHGGKKATLNQYLNLKFVHLAEHRFSREQSLWGTFLVFLVFPSLLLTRSPPFRVGCPILSEAELTGPRLRVLVSAFLASEASGGLSQLRPAAVTVSGPLPHMTRLCTSALNPLLRDVAVSTVGTQVEGHSAIRHGTPRSEIQGLRQGVPSPTSRLSSLSPPHQTIWGKSETQGTWRRGEWSGLYSTGYFSAILHLPGGIPPGFPWGREMQPPLPHLPPQPSRFLLKCLALCPHPKLHGASFLTSQWGRQREHPLLCS